MSDAIKICPADEVLLRWLRGQIDPRTGQSISQHLKECEVCADVVEGLKLYKRQEVIEMDLATLDKRIDKLVKPNFRIRLIAYAAAAMILLATGVIWMMYNKQLQQEQPMVLVPETPEQKRADVLKKADTTQEQLYAYNNENKEVPTKNEVVQTEKDVSKGLKETEANTKTVRTENVPGGASTDDAKQKQTDNTKEDLDDVDTGNKDKASGEDDKSNEVKEVSVAKRTDSKRKKESESAPQTQTKSSTDDNYAKSDDQLLKEADAYSKQGKYADAVETLDKVASKKSSPYYEESLWQKAQAQKAQGKKLAYKRTLKQIVEHKGKYAEKAKSLLEE